MAKSKTDSSDPADYGTRELQRRFTIVPVLARGPNGGMNAKVVDESEIDRLLLRDIITPHEHSILESFMRKLHKANFAMLRSPSYEAPMQSDLTIIGDKRAQLIRSIVGIFGKLDRHEKVGPAKRRALVDLVIADVEWPLDNLPGGIAALKDAIFALQDTMISR